jgi:hypothetical protein
MPCSSCKKSKEIALPHPIAESLPLPEPIPLPLPEPIKIYIPTPILEQVTAPVSVIAPQSETINQVPLKFKSEGSVQLNQNPDTFLKLVSTIPFLTSGANSYITTKSKQDISIGFIPTFFNLSYIDSAAENLENGNFQSSTTIEDNQLVTNYSVPYQTETGEKILSLTTIYDSISNYTFFSVPRDLTYNSVKEASVALVPNGSNYSGRLNIPKNFYTPSNANPKTLASLLNFYININSDTNIQIGNISMFDSSVSQCACDTVNNYSYCEPIGTVNCCSADNPSNCGCQNYPPCTV